jgi:hypothetical protein
MESGKFGIVLKFTGQIKLDIFNSTFVNLIYIWYSPILGGIFSGYSNLPSSLKIIAANVREPWSWS